MKKNKKKLIVSVIVVLFLIGAAAGIYFSGFFQQIYSQRQLEILIANTDNKTKVDLCKILSSQDVNSILGGTWTTQGQDRNCDFISSEKLVNRSGEQYSPYFQVSVTLYNSADFAKNQFENLKKADKNSPFSKGLHATFQDIPNLGDEAYSSKNDYDYFISILDGRKFFDIKVGSTEDTPSIIAKVRALITNLSAGIK